MVVSALRCSALAVLLVFASSLTCSAQDGDSRPRVSIETSMGTIVVELYNETPKHRDNFLKLAGEGFYDGTLFHRVIGGFMAQGGDPQSKDAAPGARLGTGVYEKGWAMLPLLLWTMLCNVWGVTSRPCTM